MADMPTVWWVPPASDHEEDQAIAGVYVWVGGGLYRQVDLRGHTRDSYGVPVRAVPAAVQLVPAPVAAEDRAGMRRGVAYGLLFALLVLWPLIIAAIWWVAR